MTGSSSPSPLTGAATPAALRERMAALVDEYYTAAFPQREFQPGVTPVPVAGRVFDADELRHLIEATLDFWLTTGRFAAEFERELRSLLRRAFGDAGQFGLVGQPAGAVVPHVQKAGRATALAGRRSDRPWRPAFRRPSTRLIQNGLVPVFVDVQIPTYNIDVTQLEAAVSPRTRAVMIAHTLGNPFDSGCGRRLLPHGTTCG